MPKDYQGPQADLEAAHILKRAVAVFDDRQVRLLPPCDHPNWLMISLLILSARARLQRGTSFDNMLPGPTKLWRTCYSSSIPLKMESCSSMISTGPSRSSTGRWFQMYVGPRFQGEAAVPLSYPICIENSCGRSGTGHLLCQSPTRQCRPADTFQASCYLQGPFQG